MEVLQARIDSFKKSKRVKNPNKPSSTTTVRWPHPPEFTANPETLADAGFFYDPSYEDSDNATCYICGKELGSWEADDDPHVIHWEKCGQTCCWAIVRCGLLNDVDKSGRFLFTNKTRVPTHKLMEKARFETFDVGKGWIHDQVKNHGANSKTMARAGFVYTPQQSNDDLVTCLYCDTSLSGWDAKDDPMEEHRRRGDKSNALCPFLSASVSESAPTNRAGSQSRSTKPPSKSKPPTRSTSKSNHQDILLPTKTHDGDPDNDSDSSQSTAAVKATVKTPRKGRSTSGATKTPKSKTRSSSKSSLKNVAEVEEEEAPLIAEPTVKKKSRSRSKSVARPEPEQTDAEGEIQKKPLRSRSQTKTAEDVLRKTPRSKVRALEDDEVPPKPSRTRSKTKEEEDAAPSEEKEKRKRGRPKTVKANISVASLEEPVEDKPPQEEAPVSQQADSTPLAPLSSHLSTGVPVEGKYASKTKPNSGHGDPVAKQKMKVVEISSDEEPEEETEPKREGNKVKPVAHTSKENTSMRTQVVSQPQPEPAEMRIVFSQSRKPKKSLMVEVVQPIKPGLPPVPTASPIRDIDAVMEDIEPETDNDVDPAPQTPQRPSTQAPSNNDSIPPSKTVVTEPPLIPALSKLPFTPLHALTGAELDMTVEEWIRYQMDVEYDKFRRDGERELQRFRNQAEDVRKAIEGL